MAAPAGAGLARARESLMSLSQEKGCSCSLSVIVQLISFFRGDVLFLFAVNSPLSQLRGALLMISWNKGVGYSDSSGTVKQSQAQNSLEILLGQWGGGSTLQARH